MATQIFEGLWDCPYCKATAIGGLTKHCPCCGHPQDEGTKFYMGEKKNYLDSELAEQYGKGADWLCPFCGSLNRVHYQYCTNCAGAKETSEKDYFGARKAQAEAEATQKQQQSKPGQKKKSKLPLILLAILAVLLFMFWPRTYDATISGTEWTRTIDIEAYKTVQESDWSVPSGGKVYSEKSELHHYNTVLDHYETRTRQVAEQVYDGEDIRTRYSDNGDGTFTEETYTVPRYRTEWRTETYQDPIYRKDPVYATKYYYNIDKWLYDRTEKSQGTNCDPYWPDCKLASNERAGQSKGVYILTINANKKSYRVALSLEKWSTFHTGDKVKLQVVNGTVSKINDTDIN